MIYSEYKNLKYIKEKCDKSKEKQEKAVKIKNKNSRHINSPGLVKPKTSVATEGKYCIISEAKTMMDIHTYKCKTSQKV